MTRPLAPSLFRGKKVSRKYFNFLLSPLPPGVEECRAGGVGGARQEVNILCGRINSVTQRRLRESFLILFAAAWVDLFRSGSGVYLQADPHPLANPPATPYCMLFCAGSGVLLVGDEGQIEPFSEPVGM